VTPADDRVRLFVALELPSTVRESLACWRDRAIARTEGIRPVKDESLHATLCFLGWQRSEDVDAIADACAVVAGHPQPDLTLGRGIWLPRRMPRVLAVELDDPSGSLARTQAALSKVLEAGGWQRPEKRAYLAHVTVARVGRLARGYRSAPAGVPEHSFSAERVTLYRSRLLRSGARYEALQSVELAASRA
jgi:RNA 2',3'-cyclic 3'-phosphodiesterase